VSCKPIIKLEAAVQTIAGSGREIKDVSNRKLEALEGRLELLVEGIDVCVKISRAELG